jgi:ubiquinone biosynthesis accessory factor UbiK
VDQHRIEDIARRLFESIPPSLRAAQADLETNFRSVLRSGLARLDLTTREEFDAQTRVLARTRELVEQLEARVAQLESQLKA